VRDQNLQQMRHGIRNKVKAKKKKSAILARSAQRRGRKVHVKREGVKAFWAVNDSGYRGG